MGMITETTSQSCWKTKQDDVYNPASTAPDTEQMQSFQCYKLGHQEIKGNYMLGNNLQSKTGLERGGLKNYSISKRIASTFCTPRTS